MNCKYLKDGTHSAHHANTSIQTRWMSRVKPLVFLVVDANFPRGALCFFILDKDGIRAERDAAKIQERDAVALLSQV